MGSEAKRRGEMSDFLRSRREQLVRSDFGLPPLSRARVLGLRREEISYLSGVSVTWYTWLEQGRDINPSRQVLDAVARTLRLSSPEHSYLLSLAGYSPRQATPGPSAPSMPAHVQRLLDALDRFPAYAITADWSIVGWNAAYEGLYPNVASVAVEDRNLLWLVFTDPYVRELLPDWEMTSRRFLAEFRAEAGPRLGEPRICDLIRRLTSVSDAFRLGWDSHAVGGFASRERIFRHPEAGELRFEHHQLSPADHPDLQLIIYAPLPAGIPHTTQHEHS
ncbi:MAG: helix-turn-helix transcriptional regulator [Pseudonocardiaceae bacterium]